MRVDARLFFRHTNRQSVLLFEGAQQVTACIASCTADVGHEGPKARVARKSSEIGWTRCEMPNPNGAEWTAELDQT